MAFDERGIQSLGIFYTKSVKRDGKTKELLNSKPIFFYANNEDTTASMSSNNYFQTDKFPNPFAQHGLNGALIVIKGNDGTKIKKMSITVAGVVTLADLDTGTAGSSTTKRFKPGMVQMVGTNLNGNLAIWLYSDSEANTDILHADFWKNDGKDIMVKLARTDKLRGFKNGDVIIITDKDGKTTMKTITHKANEGGITLGTLGSTVGGASSTKRWKVKNIQLIGTSNDGTKSEPNTIRDSAINVIKTVKAFIYTDKNTTMADITHANYWKHDSEKMKDIDVSKLSFVRGNMKTGDLIFINGSDTTGVFKLNVNESTNAVTIVALT